MDKKKIMVIVLIVIALVVIIYFYFDKKKKAAKSAAKDKTDIPDKKASFENMETKVNPQDYETNMALYGNPEGIKGERQQNG